MTLIIILFGVLTLLSGIIIFIEPEIIFGYFKKHIEKVQLHFLAVAIRFVLGALLISQSDASRYPLVIEILGWLSIAVAILLTVIGRDNFKRIMSWALSLEKPFVRASGLVATGFGIFLIYAFVWQ